MYRSAVFIKESSFCTEGENQMGGGRELQRVKERGEKDKERKVQTEKKRW